MLRLGQSFNICSLDAFAHPHNLFSSSPLSPPLSTAHGSRRWPCSSPALHPGSGDVLSHHFSQVTPPTLQNSSQVKTFHKAFSASFPDYISFSYESHKGFMSPLWQNQTLHRTAVVTYLSPETVSSLRAEDIDHSPPSPKKPLAQRLPTGETIIECHWLINHSLLITLHLWTTDNLQIIP